MANRPRRLLQHLLIFAVMEIMVFAHNAIVSLNVRVITTMMVATAAVAITVAVWRRQHRNANVILSRLDYGWLAFFLLTAITIVTAPFPRRSVELWLWQIGIQLPLAYAALIAFRSGWPDRSLYRAMLGVGGLLYLQTVPYVLVYFSAALSNGATPADFRLFSILTHPNIFGMMIAITTPCIVGYLFVKMPRFERAMCVLWLIGAAMALYATGSRTGTLATFIGAGLAGLLALLAHPSQPLARFTQWSAGHRVQATVAGVLLAAIMIGGIIGVVVIQSGRPSQDNGGGRLQFFRTALEIFKEQPLFGLGPGGFVFYEVSTQAKPMMPHAHNIILNNAAESGVLGLIGILTLIGVGLMVCVKGWQNYPERRTMLAGAIGGIISFYVFGLLDSPVSISGAFFLGMLLLAFVGSGLPKPPINEVVGRLRVWVIVASAWGVALLCIILLIPYSQMWEATNAPMPIIEAAKQVDSVLTYDPTDGLALLQSAYDWGKAAGEGDTAGDPNVINTAINRFERAIVRDPYLGIHKLNLAALYMQAGRQHDALVLLTPEIDRVPTNSLIWLNYGVVQEANGDSRAQITYIETLMREPNWASAGFWQTTPTRQAALEAYYTAGPQRAQYDTGLMEGNQALSEGDAATAIKAFEQALNADPTSDRKAYIEALITDTKGDHDTAVKQLTKLVDSGSGDVSVDARLKLGDIAIAQGDTDKGLNDYFLAYQYVANRGMDGFAMQGDYGYAVSAFQRFARISDYVPSVVRLDMSPERVARFKALAKALLKVHNVNEAIRLYRLVLQSNPQDMESAKALEALKAF